jgi:ferredoxin
MAPNKRQRASTLERRYREGKISRRDFLRAAALLGISLGAAEAIAACESAPIEGSATPTTLPSGAEPTVPIPGLNTDEGLIPPTSEAATAAAARPEPDSQIEAESVQSMTTPKQFSWYCACCGASFRTLEELQRHAVKEHAWRLPQIQRVDQPTYEQFLVGQVERFDEKNTVFSRTLWDKPYQAQVQEATARAPAGDWETFEGNALVAGAIYVDATAGALHPNYYGYAGYVRGAGGLFAWEDPVNEVQFPVTDPDWMSERIKQVARFYGANLVGITKLDERWVYSHYYERATLEYDRLELPYKYAIVMGIEMDWRAINQSPGPKASATTALAYSQMAELAGSLAKYIRALGYPAVPCGNDTTQSIPLAIDAGLGELGRNGLLLSPEYGPRQRLCKVLTDLPLVPDRPIDFGIQSYCETCHACAAACPVNAILWEERTTEQTSISNRPGILRWPVNVSNCYLFWRENGVDCSNCVAACPWAIHSQRDWLEL